MTLGHRVAVMHKGKLQQLDAPLNIYNQPANLFVAEFVGSSGMNLVDGEFDQPSRSFRAHGLVFAMNDAHLSKLAGRQRVTLGVRPEHIQISSNQFDGWQCATVYVTELMGSETLVFLEAEKQRLVARAPSDFRAASGTRLWFQFDRAKTHFFDSDSGQRL